MGMNSTPGSGNDEVVCFDLDNRFSLVVANSGPFFQAFGAPGAQTIFEEENTILSVRERLGCKDWYANRLPSRQTCQTVPLGPSPPSRRSRSPPNNLKRDIFSCPPVAATSQEVLLIQGFFPPS